MILLVDKINISLIIISLLNVILGGIIFINGRKQKVNIIYTLNILAILGWIVSMILFRSAPAETSLFWGTILYISATPIASSFLYFTYIFPIQKEQKLAIKALIIFIINLLIIILVAWPSLFVKEVNIKLGLEKEIIFSHYYVFYFLYILLFFSFGFVRLFLRYRKNYGIERLQILYLSIGYSLAANLAFITNLIMPWIGYFFLNWLGQIFTSVMVAFTSYAILRYRLMDIQIVIKRSAIFTVLVLVTTSLYAFVVTYLSGTFQEIAGTRSQLATGAFIGVIIALGFQPLKKFLQSTTDKFLFKDEYNFEEVLSKLSGILSTTLELKLLLEEIAAEMYSSLRLKKISIVLCNEHVNFRCAVVQNLDFDFAGDSLRAPSLLRYFAPPENHRELLILEEIKNMYINNPEENKEFAGPIAEMEKYDIALITPLFTKDRLVGFFLLGNKKSGDVFSMQDIKLLTITSSQAATAIINASLYQQSQEKVKELSSLYSLTKTFVGTLEMEKILNAIMDTIVNVGKVDRALLYLLDPTGKYLFAAIGRGDDPKIYEGLKFELEKSILKKVIQTRKPLVVEDVNKNPEVNKEYAKAVQTNSFIAVPLAVEDKIFGVIGVDNKKTKRPISSIDVNLLNTIANQAAVAISNIRLFEEQKKFSETLEEEVKRATHDLRVANRELKKLDQTKSEFISIASHQLRTPLTIIKGYISMMLEGSFGILNEKEIDSLQKVYQSNERLIHLVEDLLSISRIESGRMEFQLEPTDLQSLVQTVAEELKPNALKKDLYLDFKGHSGPLSKVNVDVKKIHEVISNLIDNGIKYTQKGGITVRIQREKDELVVSVSDTGIGISEDEEKLLFKKFSRGKGMSLLHTEGTGLGLYVCKKLIDAHEGRIWMESKGKGYGSTFSFALKVLENGDNHKNKKIK